MFDKIKFAQIIKNIKETYNSQEEFSKKSGIGRTYLSQYMNMKLDDPPKPSILQKLADSSNGIITYDELMQICGYNKIRIIDKGLFNEIITDEEWKLLFGKYESIGLTNNEQLAFYSMLENLNNPMKYDDKYFQINFNLENYTAYASNETEKNIILRLYFYILLIASKKLDDKVLYNKILNTVKKLPILSVSKFDSNHSSYYMCPVYGQISAGEPNWAEENIEGRLPIDPNLMDIINPEEYFFLRVNGESMNNVVKNGAFALIHKQDMVENGEIAVVLVNGYSATLKRFTKKGDVVVLEPDSNDPSFKTQIYDKTTPIQILGKYVGKLEINKGG